VFKTKVKEFKMQTAHEKDSTLVGSVLTVALELASKSWKLALQDEQRERPAIHTASEEGAAARLTQTIALIEAAKRKWQLIEPVRVVVMYEAGQDGFWICRALQKVGYEALVVDPASIPVQRQARRAKTDRLDALRLLSCLRGWLRGERDRMHPVRVPSVDTEALRHVARERGQLQKEIGQHRDRIRKLLRTVGCWVSVDATFAERLEQGAVHCHDGGPLERWLYDRLRHECERLALVERQFKELERSLPHQVPEGVGKDIQRLQRLCGIGEVGAFRMMLELFWRNFSNRRQVGACVGVVPQPYDSGESRIDQGISKQSNGKVRSLFIEMAWMWVRYQPKSAITLWYLQRTAGNGPGTGKRSKRIAIVAVARRLVIALWRYLKDGVVPEGSILKAMPRCAGKQPA
jgi:transposase